MFHFPLNLRMVSSLARMFLTAVLVPATAQTAPGVVNDPVAVGTAGYGVVEAGDGNYYAMSLRKPSTCAGNTTMTCSFIYQIIGKTLTNYHSFQPASSANPAPVNLDGLEPTALIVGTDGNLYGACRIGGPRGFGTIFKIAPGGTLTVLASFGLNAAGTAVDPANQPLSLIQGADGNLYFVNVGGVYSINLASGALSTVATIPVNGANQTDPDGYNASSIMQASDGNFYLTVELTPGIYTGGAGANVGGIIQVTPGGTINVVHTFAVDGSEGLDPFSPLVQGPDGFLYGATRFSNASTGNGMAFKVQPNGNGAFVSLGPLPGQDSGPPSNALTVGSDGNLYGTSQLGGATTATRCTPFGCGILFRMTPSGAFTMVYAFQGGSPASPNTTASTPVDGAYPNSPVIQTDSGEFLGSSIGFGNNSPVFFDIDLGATVSAPVKLTVTPAIAAINTPVTVTWTVSNAFSDTAQNCGAVVQGGTSGVGAWSGRQTGSLANGIYSGSKTFTPTQSGNYTLGLICGGNEAGFAELQVPAGFSIATPAFPGAQVNVDYSGAIGATGGTVPYHWTITNIPPGLTDAGGGSLTGKPTQFGDYTLPVTVTDTSIPPQQITGTVTLKVISGLKIQNKSLVKATVGSNYKQKFVAQFGQPPYKWSITAGTLPNGLTLDPVFGLLSGTPTATGNSPITVQVQDSEPTPDMVTLGLTLKVVPSVQIAGVEFTQAIQQYQNLDDLQSSISTNGEPPVPIVSGKWAVMRVYFTSLKDSTDVTLTATGDVVGVKPFTLAPNCETVDQRNKLDPCRSMDFYFMAPTGPWTTTLTLEGSNNNQLEQETFNIVSRNTSSIFLKGVSVCGVVNQPTSCGDPAVLLNILDFSNKVLPTNSVTAGTTTRKVQRNFAGSPNEAWLEDIVTGMNKYLYTGADASSDAGSNTRTDYAGVYQHIYSDTGIGWLGGHALVIADSATRQGVTATQQVLAHETGHTLNIPHTGTSDPPGSVQPSCWGPGKVSADEPNPWLWTTNRLQSSAGFEEGFDVEQQTPVDGFNDFDVMSYCMPRWISPLNYKQMFPELNGGSVTSPNTKGAPREAVAHPKPAVTFAAGSYWTVSGSIPTTGIVLDPIFTETTVGTSDPGTGTYSIQVQGASGQVLFTRSFTPVVPQTDTTGTDFQTDPIFSETIPVISGAAAIAVVDPTGASLKAVNITGTAPTVTMTSPGTGFVGTAQQSLSWMVTSPTATSFTSRIFYSTDAGVKWQQVIDTTDTSAVIDFDTMPGATAALIRIDASDGVNTGSATSAAFSVPRKLPKAVVINNPVSGSTFPAANPLLLSGGAYDPDDGFLSGKALAWSDSAQGSLGSGSPLPVTLKPGSHTITLTATDSDGNALTATTQITLGGAAPAVSVTKSQNSTCYSATINAAPGAQGASLTAANYSLDGGNTYTAIPLASLPFTLPLNGTGTVNVVAFATDASGQVSSQSTAVNLGTGCASSTVKASAGSGQSAVVGTAFATALTTLVVDLNGNPVSGTLVTYAAPASGAGAVLSAATATTNASGIATVTATANTTAGAYNVTASATNGTSTATFALTNSDFQIAAGAATLTVPRGSTGTDTITLTALGGFSGTVTFGCSGLPAGATCTFAPATVTPTVATASTTMTIAASQTASLRWPAGGGSIAVCTLLACIIRRRKYFSGLAIIASMIALIGLTACGSSTHTKPNAATINVTASAGSVQRTTTVTLQIQ